MGSRVKGVVRARPGNQTEYSENENSLDVLPKSLPIAERAERVKEYREKRREPAESAYTSENTKIVKEKDDFDEQAKTENAALMLSKPYIAGFWGFERAKNAATEEESRKNDLPKEIAFFSEPKRVKKKTQRSIVIFQTALCAAVCLIMLISKLAVPQLYENLHIYLTRLFGC